ncbi:hypothetical protein GCM10007242_32990 [Pigmentiphaga litoralis]|nr:hypothetical protein GCM10007242_32990 [Pigmentiphaga litoralis]
MPSLSASKSLAAWLRLSFEPGVGPITAYGLLQEFGPPDQLYAQGLDALSAKLPLPLARQLAAPADDATRRRIDDALAWADRPGNYLMTLNDRHYPPALLATHDPPTLLYVKGLPPLLGRHGLAIVGSRNATPDGLGHAREFAQHLAGLGYTIVSGLALGIDAAAHEGALAAGADGGGTLAVVGTGADVVYPRSTAGLPSGSPTRARSCPNCRWERAPSRTTFPAATGWWPGCQRACWWSKPPSIADR